MPERLYGRLCRSGRTVRPEHKQHSECGGEKASSRMRKYVTQNCNPVAELERIHEYSGQQRSCCKMLNRRQLMTKDQTGGNAIKEWIMIRNPMLYPPELREHLSGEYYVIAKRAGKQIKSCRRGL